MFTENKNRVSGCYGSNRFVYDGSNGISIYDMKNQFVEAWEDCKECAPDYMQDMTGEKFFQSFVPEDIVEDAGA